MGDLGNIIGDFFGELCDDVPVGFCGIQQYFEIIEVYNGELDELGVNSGCI